MAFTLSASTGIIGFETNDAGHLTRGRINSVPTTGLDTTAALYAAGCQITDSSTGLVWFNTGTPAVPSWAVGAPEGAQLQVSIPAASVPLLFGGTSVQLLPAPLSTQAYVVQGMALEYVGAGTAYTAGGSTVRVVYGSAGTNVAIYGAVGTAVFFATTTKYFQFAPTQPTAGQTIVPGMGLYLDNTTAAFATGTGSLKATVWYSIVNV